MILMEDDAVDVEQLGFGGGGWELEDEDLSIDLDSLMLMLEDGDQLTDQMSLIEYGTNDAQQSGSRAIVSSIPGNSDQGHGSCSQITSPIQSCSGSLKDWIPLEPEYENSTANVPHSRIPTDEGSGVSSENTSQNIGMHVFDDLYFQDNQYQFADSLPINSAMFLPTQYDKNSNGSHFLDTPNPYSSESFDFHSMASNEDVTTAGRDEDNFYLAMTEFGDRSSDHSQMGKSEVYNFDSNRQDIKQEDAKSSTPFSHSSLSYNGQLSQQSQSSNYPDDRDRYVFNDIKIDMNGYKSSHEMNEDDTRIFHRNVEDMSSSEKSQSFRLRLIGLA